MSQPTAAQPAGSTPPRPIPCMHCGYNLRGVPPEGKCSECGNPVSDTREGTLFYRLPPTHLGTILTGAALVCAMHTVFLLFAVFDAARWILPGGLPDVVFPLWDAVRIASHLLFVPWVASFVLAAPLNRSASWASLMRIAAIALAIMLVLVRMGLDYHVRASPPVGPGPSGVQIVGHVVTSTFEHLPVVLACVRLYQISRRLPAAPFASLGSWSIVCAILLLVRTGIDSSGLLYPYAIPQAGVAGLTALMWLAPAVFPFLIHRELRAVARDVNADHPYTRV